MRSRYLTAVARRRLFIPAAAAALAMMAAMSWLGQPLQTAAAPAGIVSYEFAGSPAAASQILASWDEAARLVAAFTLGLDYLFMPLYALAIWLGCSLVASRGRRLAGLGMILARGQWLAAGLDAVENVALWQQLQGATAVYWPPVAFWCATIKFALIAAGLLYAAIGAVAQRR